MKKQGYIPKTKNGFRRFSERFQNAVTECNMAIILTQTESFGNKAAKQKMKIAKILRSESAKPASDSALKKMGRRLTLEFFQDENPKLERITYCHDLQSQPVSLQRGGMDSTKRFNWTAVPKSLSLLFLDYCCAVPNESLLDFIFPWTSAERRLAISIGDNFFKPAGLIGKLFVSKQKGSAPTLIANMVFDVEFETGTTRPEVIRLKKIFLPSDCVEIIWSENKLKNASDIRTLAERIRKSIGLNSKVQANDSIYPNTSTTLPSNQLVLHDQNENRPNWARGLPNQLLNTLTQLKISKEIQEIVGRVLSHPDYPSLMAISGQLVRNPIWDQVAEEKRTELLRLHQLDGTSPPDIYHLDLFLIRRKQSHGHGQFFNYYSKTCQANMFPFREWRPDDDAGYRAQLNAELIEKYCGVSSDAVLVNPMTGKHVVSVKPHPQYGDLTIYVFEFCSVEFLQKPNRLSETGRTTGGKWFNLDTLTADKKSWSENADVIRAVKKLCSATLNCVPFAFSERLNSKAKKKNAKR